MNINLDSIAGNPFLTLATFGLAILGIALAIFFYVKSKKEKIPCFEKSSNTLIEGLQKSLDGLELLYKGSAQERITVTKIVFWNAGRETINKSDLLLADPLRVICPVNLDVLDIQVTEVSEVSNSVLISEPVRAENGLYYPINFEYLDHEDYFVLQIVHNGTSDEKFEVLGKIKGVKVLQRVTGTQIEPRLFRMIPLPLDGVMMKLVRHPVFIKYGGSIVYAGFGVYGVWNLVIGKTNWYVWVLTGLAFFFSGVMYFGYRYIPPVRI